MFAIVIGNGDLKQSLSSSLDELGLGFNYVNCDKDMLEIDLKKIGLYRADLLICLTDEDDFNFYFCKKAKVDYNVPLTLALANCSDNIETMKLQGIDFVICPNLFILNSLKRILSLNKTSYERLSS
ncbi:NAD-binding protein [Clostridium frigidicarnis]|uniref:TrkA-N domain-containing protein n=1 Tax=Clostridium frigidicarnis TaxID=84698 RepID=A0A1I0WF20_9CLOT|nr:NAD-binding protein [Clostridium frigidicarnis]SFA87007.1 TrkA-N domain-containing protein [Clostridium frigidicarnis]